MLHSGAVPLISRSFMSMPRSLPARSAVRVCACACLCLCVCCAHLKPRLSARPSGRWSRAESKLPGHESASSAYLSSSFASSLQTDVQTNIYTYIHLYIQTDRQIDRVSRRQDLSLHVRHCAVQVPLRSASFAFAGGTWSEDERSKTSEQASRRGACESVFEEQRS